MSRLAGYPIALQERAIQHLGGASLLAAMTGDLRRVAVDGDGVALSRFGEWATTTALLAEEARERYRAAATALHEYALVLEAAQRRVDAASDEDSAAALRWASEEVEVAASRAIAAIDTAPTPALDDDRPGSALGLLGLLGHVVAIRARVESPALAAARRLRADSLDGRPYDVRHAHHNDLLNRLLLADSGIGATTRTRLNAIAETLRQHPDARLVTFWLDGDEPRVALAFGDLEQADSVTYVVHGISTDTAQTASLGRTVHDLYADAARHPDRHEAFIAWLNYDSGDIWSEPGIELADRGAATLVADVEALRRRNPDAVVNGIFHSYGSTTFGQSVIAAPTAFDNAYLLGSPGLSRAAARALEAAIADGGLAVHATQAQEDRVAPIGVATSWEHPEPPLRIEGVSAFSAEGFDAQTHRVVVGRGIAQVYDPGTGGVDGHDLDRPDGADDDFYGYLTRESAPYAYIRTRLTEGG